jgi:Phenazine biosynthesis-like protein
MPVLQYVHLDVFTDQPFTGNQLAVFLDAAGIDERRMQRIANELALPETTFVLPPEAPGTDARVRIFTSSRELPMAGHPTIGTTFALAGAGRLRAGADKTVLGLGIGPTTVGLEWSQNGLRFAWMTQPDSDIRAHRHRHRCGCRGSRGAAVRPYRRRLAGPSSVVRSPISVHSAKIARGGRFRIPRTYEVVHVAPRGGSRRTPRFRVLA